MKLRHLAALLPALLSLAVPMPVLADCQPAASIEEALASAPVAFVGRTVMTRENASGAVLQVEEVWVGEVPSPVEIHGMELGQGNQMMEDDRFWKANARYLVIPYRGEAGRLHDNICTATTEWSAELAALRPADARVIAREAEAAASFPILPLLAAGLAVMLLAGAGVIAFRSGRPAS